MQIRECDEVERRTFLITPDGTVAAVWRVVKEKDHVGEIITKINELSEKREYDLY
jgi:peroxiredoxin Q/BCP